jgi:hypothetical protein
MLFHRLGNLSVILAAGSLVACGNWGSRTAQIPTTRNVQTGFASLPGAIGPQTSFVPDRIYLIVMENQSFDNVIGSTTASGYRLLAPFLTQAALTNRLATLAFGVTHPSLPNYLSLLAGNSFGIHDDNASCYGRPRQNRCHSFDKKNLVDSLEAAGITWASFNESMPKDGFLGETYPHKGDGLYRQKHNPFVYFKDIATNPKRLARVKTFVDLKNAINAGTLPRFSFIVPNECHDMHSSVPFCPGPNSKLIEAGDTAVQKLVEAIIGSGAFTQRSLIFIIWDEGGNSNLGCCDSPPEMAGGHTSFIIIAGVPGAKTSSQPYNEYSVLSTIETLWKLPKLGYTADTDNVKPMLDLLPSK